MISRRDLLLGGAFFASSASAYALKPTKRIALLRGRKISDIVPAVFGDWESQTAEGLVRPETEGKLAAKLYSEMVGRIYMNRQTGDLIMMLIAYGDTQSDLLQLHRPEACYPAVGFRVTKSDTAAIPIANGVLVTGRHVVAERTERQECITYWTRLGEFLPDSESAQREARLRTAMQGVVPDGALFRFSTVGTADKAFPMIDGFIAAMLAAVAPNDRPALLGHALAKRTLA